MNQVIDIHELKKSFASSPWRRGRLEALRGISLQVEEGEVCGLLGRNGAGKTTTLKTLTGLLRPDAGHVRLWGEPSYRPEARRNLGYLPENPYFSEHLTPREGLEFYARLSGMGSQAARARIPELLERVGLTAAAGRRMRNFSKGMRQRFGLAAALVAEPRLLLLDEPLSGLDPAGRRLVKEIVLDEARAGRTVLMCSHVLADVQELCGRIVVLHRGAIVRDGRLTDLLSAEPSSFELCVERPSAALRHRLQEAADRFQDQDVCVRARLAGPEAGPRFAAEALREGARVRALVPEQETLEAWFVRLTEDPVVEPLAPEYVAS